MRAPTYRRPPRRRHQVGGRRTPVVRARVLRPAGHRRPDAGAVARLLRSCV